MILFFLLRPRSCFQCHCPGPGAWRSQDCEGGWARTNHSLHDKEYVVSIPLKNLSISIIASICVSFEKSSEQKSGEEDAGYYDDGEEGNNWA